MQYNLVPADGRWRSSAGKVTSGLAESNGSQPPGGWLSHLWADCLYTWDQLRAQRSVTTTGELLPFLSKNMCWWINVRLIRIDLHCCISVVFDCMQVVSLRYSALCLLECESGLTGGTRGRHYDFCLVILANPPSQLQNLVPADIHPH